MVLEISSPYNLKEAKLENRIEISMPFFLFTVGNLTKVSLTLGRNVICGEPNNEYAGVIQKNLLELQADKQKEQD